MILSGSVAASGSPYEVLEAWRRGDFILVTREDIISEVVEVLGRPYYRERRHVTDEITAGIAQALRTHSVHTDGKLTIEAIAEDPDDNKLLACAIEGEADYIVSGDHHLLNLGSYRAIYIVRPATFLRVLQDAG